MPGAGGGCRGRRCWTSRRTSRRRSSTCRRGCRITGRRSTAASRRWNWRPDASGESRSMWMPASSRRAWCSATPVSLATPARTTGRSPSGTSTAMPHVFDCFERIRDTAAAMRQALAAGDWDEVAQQLSIEWANRKRLAPGVTTAAIDDLIARAEAAGATAAKVCGAGGGGCLVAMAPPIAHGRGPRGARRRRRQAPRLHYRDRWPPPGITRPSRACSCRSPICSS